MNRKKNKFSLLVFLLALYSLVFTPISRATELVISGNGSDSSSEIVNQEETQTQISQTNEADVQNKIQVNSNTGENTASGNTGSDVNIETGDTNSQVAISNQVNSSVVESSSCCTAGTNALIDENGSGSDNNIDLNNKNNTYVNVNQTANITNSISGTINTGGNTANNNTDGSVSISTGDINVKTTVNNGSINTSDVSVNGDQGGNLTAKISGNGSGSNNKIAAEFENDSNVFINHASSMENFLIWDLNTGGNEANGNSKADVSIKTGDINFEAFINNFINLSNVSIEGCCEDPDDDPGDEIDDPEDGDKEDPKGGVGFTTSSTSSGSMPAGAEVGAGGPGILGLSDTSSDQAQALFFFLGLAFFAFGGKIVTDELIQKISKREVR